jgi:REP element-mobilizing transposase RayT
VIKRPETWVSRRLPAFDYRDPGEYFVTICTRGRICLLGEISSGVMQLSSAGRIAEDAWQHLPIHFPHLGLDVYVIMPNHIHGMLVYHEPGPSLGTVVGGFKAEVSRRLGQRVWQRYFYDHVIRRKKSLDEIRSYIELNPMRWSQDRENPDARSEAG